MKNITFVILSIWLACSFFCADPAFAVEQAQQDSSCEGKFRNNNYSVYLVDGKEGFACGDNGLIFHTVDGGISWETQPSGTKESLFCLSFVDSKVGWAVGNKGIILKTTDGGKNWKTQKSPKNKILFECVALSADKAIACGDWGTIVATTDGGKTWVDRTYPKDMMMYGMAFANENEGWIAGEFGIILHTVDGGVTWEKQETTEFMDNVLFSIVFRDLQNGLACGNDGLILRTADGGRTWNKVEYTTLADERSKEAIEDILAKAKALNSTGGVQYSLVKQYTARRPLFKIAALGDIAITAGDAGVLLMSSDTGKTWKEVTTLPQDMGLLWFKGLSLARRGGDIVGTIIGAKSVCLITENSGFRAIGYMPNVDICEPIK